MLFCNCGGRHGSIYFTHIVFACVCVYLRIYEYRCASACVYVHLLVFVCMCVCVCAFVCVLLEECLVVGEGSFEGRHKLCEMYFHILHPCVRSNDVI